MTAYHERRTLETGMDRWLDRKITLGNIITLIILLITGLMGYARLMSNVESISKELVEHKQSQYADMNAYVRRDVQETRNRFIDERLSNIERKLDMILEQQRKDRGEPPPSGWLRRQ